MASARNIAVSSVMLAYALALFAPAACAGADQQEWIIQHDISEGGEGGKTIHRIEARLGSVVRDGIWSQFDQRLLIKRREDGIGMVEMRRVAVNCLTGAWDIISSKSYDLTPAMAAKPASQSSKPLGEVEATTMFRVDPLKVTRGGGLHAETFIFGCRCQRAASQPRKPARVAEADIKRFYESDVLTLPRQREYRVAMIKLDERAQALEVIKRLDRGAKFEQLAYELNSDIVKQAHPGGDLGFHHESRWGARTVVALRKLKVGEYTREPVEGVFGFDVFKLLDLRVIAPPSIEQARARIVAYLQAERACGRQ